MVLKNHIDMQLLLQKVYAIFYNQMDPKYVHNLRLVQKGNKKALAAKAAKK